MRKSTTFCFLFFWQFTILAQTIFNVSSQSQFDSALDQANEGDSIVWDSGTYPDIFMDIDEDGVVITAEVNGGVVFNGASRVVIRGDQITLSGFQFIGGDIGTNDVIEIRGSDILITQININEYTCYKYLIVDEESRFTTISFSNFENRLNLDDQNILSILIGEQPGFHKVQYCSFKNFDGEGNDFGIEPIRIGLSTQGNLNGRNVVEFCYFSNCDGDGELISYKGAQNIIRYNTFIDNSVAELVLRNGDQAVVYGNFFINNMGGIRVREGQNHFIYNNYFQDLDRRAIFLQNDPVDPLDNIHIYFNTIINSGEIRLGGSGDSPPSNVYFANNIFSNPTDDLFEDPTGNEMWLGNISSGSLGISRPNTGLEDIDPQLVQNELGYFQLEETSPAINAGVSGYPDILEFEGVEFDSELLLDLLMQSRPEPDVDKDVGAVEFSTEIVQPHATEQNTGPSYLSTLQFVSINTSATEGGSVLLEPEQQEYALGSIINATAIPNELFVFAGWQGDLEGTENPQRFEVMENMEIRAIFEPSIILSSNNEFENQNEISVYPNPSSERLSIKVNSPFITGLKFEVFSIEGRKTSIHSEFVSVQDALNSGIDISTLLPGIYFVKMEFYSTDRSVQRSQLMRFVKN
ncbi:MAG: chondroitinase-B domain-containing protein [Bacteroidota bacterium]